MSALKSRLYELEIRKKTQSIQDAHDTKGDAGWGNQIRSYVLQPYQLIKDLRTNYETSNSQRVLDGDLTDFMSATLALELSGKTRSQSQTN
jgi:peptide chain release factor 2